MRGYRRDGGLVGVVGGVGPLATAHFLDRLVRLTDATRDQDHVNVLVLHHPAIPDRTDYILGRSDRDPAVELAADIRALTGLGADAIAIPCNTASHFIRALRRRERVEILDIVTEVIDRIVVTAPGCSTIGVLATDGTLRAGTYDRAARARGLRTLVPAAAGQERIRTIIYDQVKAGLSPDTAELARQVDALARSGADVVVLACTELSVAARGMTFASPVVDAMDALAARVIVHSGGRLRGSPPGERPASAARSTLDPCTYGP